MHPIPSVRDEVGRVLARLHLAEVDFFSKKDRTGAGDKIVARVNEAFEAWRRDDSLPQRFRIVIAGGPKLYACEKELNEVMFSSFSRFIAQAVQRFREEGNTEPLKTHCLSVTAVFPNGVQILVPGEVWEEFYDIGRECEIPEEGIGLTDRLLTENALYSVPINQ